MNEYEGRVCALRGPMTFTSAAMAGGCSAVSRNAGARDMNILAVQHGGPLAINMNQPVSFLHWSIFTVWRSWYRTDLTR